MDDTGHANKLLPNHKSNLGGQAVEFGQTTGSVASGFLLCKTISCVANILFIGFFSWLFS